MSINARYYNLGIELGLRPGTIAENQLDLTKALTEVLLTWLKRQYDVEKHGRPTWQKLKEAVDSPSGGDNPALTEKIAEKHLVFSMSHHSNLSLSPSHPLSLGQYYTILYYRY